MDRNATHDVIVIVDACKADYAALVIAGGANEIACTFLDIGERAMRRPADDGIRAWMINLKLPDMAGLELYELLRSRLSRIPVFMVDDHYDAVHEVSVLAVGHPYYVWKPLDGSWVGNLRPEVSDGKT